MSAEQVIPQGMICLEGRTIRLNCYGLPDSLSIIYKGDGRHNLEGIGRVEHKRTA